MRTVVALTVSMYVDGSEPGISQITAAVQKTTETVQHNLHAAGHLVNRSNRRLPLVSQIKQN